jgi:16S rRNA (guanine527-N7)-methyltransferase
MSLSRRIPARRQSKPAPEADPGLVIPPGEPSTPGMRGLPEELRDSLERARTLGYLGPGPLEPQIDHASAFAASVAALGKSVPATVLDLGSGGGLPGLVLAFVWESAQVLLLEASGRRAIHLQDSVERLGWSDRVAVVRERAESAGRDSTFRGRLDVVVARSFGRPAVTAECAAPFLRVGGILVVSEPPDPEAPPDPERATPPAPLQRWPAEGLGMLGMEAVPPTREPGAYAFQVIRQVTGCPERFPRRVGVAAKRPLFGVRRPRMGATVPRGTPEEPVAG